MQRQKKSFTARCSAIKLQLRLEWFQPNTRRAHLQPHSDPQTAIWGT